MSQLNLGFNLNFVDLYARNGLERVDLAFLEYLDTSNSDLGARLKAARINPTTLGTRHEANLLVALAPQVDDFLAKLFGIETQVAELAAYQQALKPLLKVKRRFVQRQALKNFSLDEARNFNLEQLTTELEQYLGSNFDELKFATAVSGWMETGTEALLNLAARYIAARVAQSDRDPWVLCRIPGRNDPLNLVPAIKTDTTFGQVLEFPSARQHSRDGFNLTDVGANQLEALDQVTYCIFCHHQEKSSCAQGLYERKTGALMRNTAGVLLEGCPLEERISEMHEVKALGLSLAALAMAVVDNPMVAATGHRICNNCMDACIYQNQQRDPVDVPQTETRILKDVLALPWGFEIYSLLTRWNPLNLRRPLPAPPSGRSVLVVGLGPAGFTLAHHLMQDGHAVVAIDGVKIEPLPPELSGIDIQGNRIPFRPVRDAMTELWEPLGQRILAGFGGVAEYGITVRWDKNFLKVIRLLLERRDMFRMYGGIRFGGALGIEDALELGFDHVALAMGAGRPTLLELPNGLARGVRQASDFLMALQLTGAADADQLANLQLRLPVVVIGGGLTAIDSCTEALAYYPVQVEKFLSRYEILCVELGETAVRQHWSEEEATIADEFITHAYAIRSERLTANAEGCLPQLNTLLAQWGGATVAYRRRLIDSPAYRNHVEVIKALEEGIKVAEGLTPHAVHIDRFGHASGLEVRNADGNTQILPARTILIAAGTVPNTTLAHEYPGVHVDGKFFRAIDELGQPVHPEQLTKPRKSYVLMQVDGITDGRVSFFGDLHPSYAGSVVSAMASAKQGCPIIARELACCPPPKITPTQLVAKLDAELYAQVHSLKRLAPTVVEVVIKAPMAARAFRPGQFFRLQNFASLANRVDETALVMESVALTGAWTDPHTGLIGLVVLETGGSSTLCALLQPGEPVVLMGPTGTPTHIPNNETVLLVGGGLGNLVLFSIGRALRQAGSTVLYVSGYRHATDCFKSADIEAAADAVVWCVDQGPVVPPTRPQDRTFIGNVVEAMLAYAEGRLGLPPIALTQIDRIIAIGSDRMMAAVTVARHGSLAQWLKPEHIGIGSINSPMQCMMKEICGQCLQRQTDPTTGRESIIFSCRSQDQLLDHVDFHNLAERLGQNSLCEKLTKLWIERCLRHMGQH